MYCDCCSCSYVRLFSVHFRSQHGLSKAHYLWLNNCLPCSFQENLNGLTFPNLSISDFVLSHFFRIFACRNKTTHKKNLQINRLNSKTNYFAVSNFPIGIKPISVKIAYLKLEIIQKRQKMFEWKTTEINENWFDFHISKWNESHGYK